MTPKELEKYARVCKRNGISHLKLEGLEFSIEVADTRQPVTSVEGLAKEPLPEVTEEELMFYSST